MDDLISIIVPVYNVEQYLNKCINSILSQSYHNLEIILVDDGSTDNCPQICDEYSLKDIRIKVIHKKNGGLSDARNVGNAKGKYIAFIDSDDYISKYFIEVLYKSLVNNDSDLSECDYLNVENDNEEVQIDINNINGLMENYTGNEMLNNLYSNDGVINVIACNKLYKKKLFSDIRYPTGKIHEDEGTTYKLLYKVKKATIIRKKLYYYRNNPNSITRKEFNIKRLDILDILKDRILFFESHDETELRDKTIKAYLYTLINLYWKCKKYLNKTTKHKQRELLKEYKLYYKIVIKSKYISIKSKFVALFILLFPNLYGIIFYNS